VYREINRNSLGAHAFEIGRGRSRKIVVGKTPSIMIPEFDFSCRRGARRGCFRLRELVLAASKILRLKPALLKTLPA
jgi:hypothetical protein